ncbi:uncharacterized protein LOC124269215 [Haliotis rubra]|uniref:uncharacterized protein LOC124269215 n=1 Tax=Haliotis rubra TaxID=36100 RepID=UPI001EE5C958|nr:uncharacterized protein LOC124269215 [Haliotis rubra]
MKIRILLPLLLCALAGRLHGLESHDACLQEDREWVKVLETSENGTVLFGRKQALQETVKHGGRIRIGRSTYFTEADNCQNVKGEVCCEALMHISKNGWNIFQTNVYWWMSNVCTTGNWHMIRYYVGGTYLSESRHTYTLTWFVLKTKTIQPVYSTFGRGTLKSGSVDTLISSILQGNSISVSQEKKAVFPVQNIEIFNTGSGGNATISAEHIWSVSQTGVGNHLEFQGNAYWWFLILNTAGTRTMSRWNLGSHTARGQSQDKVVLDWFVDPCWVPIHNYSDLVSDTLWTRYTLQRLIEAGHNVKVKFGNTIVAAESIRLTDKHVAVQSISSLARADSKTFVSDLNWEFRVLSTTGSVRTYRPLVGSSSTDPLGYTVGRQAMTWYVDTRRWHLLFHLLLDGKVAKGSALAVRQAVQDGADIRVAFKLPNDHGFRYHKVDNIGLGPTPDLAAQIVRALRDNATSCDEFELDRIPQWSFKLITTTGFVHTSNWVVGDHVSKGRTSERAEIKWFASF